MLMASYKKWYHEGNGKRLKELYNKAYYFKRKGDKEKAKECLEEYLNLKAELYRLKFDI